MLNINIYMRTHVPDYMRYNSICSVCDWI